MEYDTVGTSDLWFQKVLYRKFCITIKTIFDKKYIKCYIILTLQNLRCTLMCILVLHKHCI